MMFDWLATQNINVWSLAQWFVFCWFAGYAVGYVYASTWRFFRKF